MRGQHKIITIIIIIIKLIAWSSCVVPLTTNHIKEKHEHKVMRSETTHTVDINLLLSYALRKKTLLIAIRKTRQENERRQVESL